VEGVGASDVTGVSPHMVVLDYWALEKFRMNNDFFMNVLFSDESTFTNREQVNKHNLHYWAVNNPHCLREVER